MGVEMLINALVRALGIDPQQLLTAMREFMEYVYGKIGEIDNRMNSHETTMQEILAELRKMNGSAQPQDTETLLLPFDNKEETHVANH